uniref:Uncharacterized protein n=1 Tax=Arion vulgaris TaxID=1028688 RepID=A0A0B7APS3_9EUPU
MSQHTTVPKDVPAASQHWERLTAKLVTSPCLGSFRSIQAAPEQRRSHPTM